MDLSNVYYLHEIGGKANQEDYIWPTEGTASLEDKVFIVCDGVGGSENGEVASRIISESMGKALLTCSSTTISPDYINSLLLTSKQAMINYARLNGLSLDMATTFTAVILYKSKAFVAWCGDSRVYHLRKGEVLYKSSDHSLVNLLVKNGEITEEEAMTHPQKNIILKAIKADSAAIEAECDWIVDVQAGDYFLLCTDGLLENITNKDLKFLLNQNDKGNIDLVQSFQQFCLNKTKDNYSMYLLKVKNETKLYKYRPKIYFLASLLVMLVASSLILIRAYYRDKVQTKKTNPERIINDSNTINQQEQDSISYVDFVSRNKDTTRSFLGTTALTTGKVMDTATKKKTVTFKSNQTTGEVDTSKTYEKAIKTDTLTGNSKFIRKNVNNANKVDIDSILKAPD